MQEMEEMWVWSLGQEDSPGVGNGNWPQYSCLEKFHGQRSLLGYIPWVYKELGTTEQLNIHVYCLNICDKQLAWFGSLILNTVSDIQKPTQTIYWKSDRKRHVSSLTFTKLCDFLCKLPIIQKISLKRQYLPKRSLCAECSVRRPGPR